MGFYLARISSLVVEGYNLALGRRLAGVVVGVEPCLHISGLDIVYVHESLTQIALFVHRLKRHLLSLRTVVYDSWACVLLRRAVAVLCPGTLRLMRMGADSTRKMISPRPSSRACFREVWRLL